MQPTGPDPMDMRASDADREAYVTVLQDAYIDGRLSHDEHDERVERAYRATTYADLVPLVSDLPVDRSRLPAMPAARAAAAQPAPGYPQRVGGGSGSDSAVAAIFSEAKRDGRWVVSESQTAVAVFGSATVDLREAVLAAPDSEMRVSAVFGQVDVIVPEDIRVEVSGVGIFGEYKREDDRESGRRGTDPPPGSPTIRFTGAAVFGQVTITVATVPATGPDRVLPGAHGGPELPPGRAAGPALPPGSTDAALPPGSTDAGSADTGGADAGGEPGSPGTGG